MSEYTKQMIFVIGFGILIAICVITGIHSFIKELKKRKADYERLDDPIEKAPTEIRRAQVTNKYTDIVQTGSRKNPSHRIGFFVTFTLDNGKNITLDVGKKYFKRIKQDSKGDLATSEGEFIDFK